MIVRQLVPKTLKLQLLVYGAIAILIATVVIGSLDLVISENNASRERRALIFETAIALRSAMEHADLQQAQEVLDSFDKSIGAAEAREILLVDSQGLVVASSQRETIGKTIEEATEHQEPELRQMLAGLLPEFGEEMTHRGIRVLDLSLPLYGDPTQPTRVTGALHYAEPFTTYNDLQRQNLIQYALSGLLLTAFLIVPLWFYLEHSILRHVHRIVSADRAVAVGRLEERLIPAAEMPYNEIGNLMRSRQEMLTRLESAETELRQRLKDLAVLNATAASLSVSLELRHVLERILAKVMQITHADLGEICLVDPENGRVLRQAQMGYPTAWLAQPDQPTRCYCTRNMDFEDPQCLEYAKGAPATDLQCIHDPSFFSSCIVPLRADENALGVISLHHRTRPPYAQRERDLLSAIGSQIGVALNNIYLYRETQRLSVTDALTGLCNRRALEERLQEEWRRAKRYSHPLSVIMADIDRFKTYNDTYGHPKGDIILRQVARVLSISVRETDFVARYGGEEFIVLLPETPKADALKVAEKIRAAVAMGQFPHAHTQPGGNLTISLGVATFPDDLPDAVDLIQKADDALYRAKGTGRNRVSGA